MASRATASGGPVADADHPHSGSPPPWATTPPTRTAAAVPAEDRGLLLARLLIISVGLSAQHLVPRDSARVHRRPFAVLGGLACRQKRPRNFAKIYLCSSLLPVTDAAIRPVTDVGALRALAHPLRVMLLAALRMDGPGTASSLARRFNETSGATSYHLRQLARFGFVEEDPSQPSRRERRWRAAHAGSSVSAERFVDDPAGREAIDWLTRNQIRTYAHIGEQWVEEREEWPAEWVRAASANDWWGRLTPAALRRWRKESSALLDRLERECARADDTERVAVYVQAVPVREGVLP